LANGNGVSFPDARTQVVAGRVNRESSEVEPIGGGEPILALCWPRGSTSDPPGIMQLVGATAWGYLHPRLKSALLELAAPVALQEVPVSAQRVTEEQLGDLKLYRVPERTTFAARQSKQVRLLDRSTIPIETVYGVDLWSDQKSERVPATKRLRTKNNAANHLGLPLPSGQVAVFAVRGSDRLLEHESGLHDLAVDEDLEIDLGAAPDVGVVSARTGDSRRVEISNARAAQIEFELSLRLPDGVRVVAADRPWATKNGRPMFRLTVPGQSSVSVLYRAVRDRARPRSKVTPSPFALIRQWMTPL
jgi:hypothetical protein